jgi:plastocyanin
MTSLNNDLPSPDLTAPDETEDRTGLSRRAIIAALAGMATALPTAVAVGAGLRHDDEDDHEGSGEDDHQGDDKDDHDDDHGATAEDDDDDDDGMVTTLEDGSIEVRITDDDSDAFLPQVLAIKPGQSVTFVNRDDDPHTATGSDWDTGTLQPGDSAKIAFDTPGEFAYACQFHPIMTGTIMVEGAVASPQASPAASGNSIRIVNLAYDPPELEVAAGTTVTWTNEDQVAHTATSSDGVFDTGTIAAGESSEVTFDEAGTFEYVCAFHAGMRATVVVS